MKPAAILELLRPRQWIKNLFVLAPLFFSPDIVDAGTVGKVMILFIAFCLVASGLYCLNDFCDRRADRQHPQKRLRPLPSGEVSPALAIILFAVLAGSGIGLAFWSTEGGPALVAYFVLISLYSLWLKHFAIIDVMAIAIGFVLRIYAGALAIGVEPTVWIVVCTGMLALFIALSKRRDDLTQELSASHRQSLGGYSVTFLDAAQVVVLSALLVSYVIFTTDESAMLRLGSQNVYLTIPFVVAGTLRYLQQAIVYRRSGAPTDLALSDPFLVLTVLGWLATFAVLIYG